MANRKKDNQPMTQMLIDGIKAITLHSNVVRIQCVLVGAEGKPEDGGTLLIPGAEVASTIQTLVNGLQEVQKQLRERAAAPAPEPPKTN
jgi:hypothetical protein